MIKSIKLCLVLGLGALPVVSTFVVLPSTAVAKAECNCSNLKTLQAELRNAIHLQEGFRNKSNEFRTLGKGASTIALQQFANGDARSGLEPIPGNKGPNEVDYIPAGRDIYDAAGIAKHSTDELCKMSPSSVAVLELAIENAECPAIGEALRAHEKVHINFCQRIGFLPYEEMHGADRAREEAEAYGAQIKVLQDIIAKLRCGYRATAQMADTKFSGVICSLEKPFTIEGNNPVMTYPMQFTPSSVNSGTWTFNAIAHGVPVRGFGSGNYTVEGANTATPRLVLSGSSTGIAPPGTVTKSGSSSFDLVPLDTDECAQSPQ